MTVLAMIDPWLAGPRSAELLFPLLALPVLGLLLAPLLGAAGARVLALTSLLMGLALALGVAVALVNAGDALIYSLGGWTAPLVSSCAWMDRRQ